MTPTSKTLLPERRVEIHASAPARISMMGSRAWLIEAPGAFDLPAQRRIWSMAQNLQQWPAVESLIPGVTNLLVLLHDTPEEPTAVERRLHEYWLSAQALNLEGRQIDIPVCYGGEHATDLEAVCRHTGFSAREVIRRHSQGVYTVVALGSAPGFGYLHGLDPRLATRVKGAFAEYAQRDGHYWRSTSGGVGVDRTERLECNRLRGN